MKQKGKWITGGLIGVGVILIILGLTIGSGGDENGSSTTAAATGATGPAVAEQGAQPESGTRSQTPSTDGKQTAQSGGSGAASGKTANGGGTSTQPSGAKAKPEQNSKRKSKPKATPPASLKDVRIEDLSPADRRKLQKDLYSQGKNTCFAYGPELLAKEYNFTTSDPQEVARRFANLNEQGNASLALPYQQGCIAGFKRYAREHK